MRSASESHANRIHDPIHNQKQIQKQKQGIPLSAESGAAAPLKASDVVRRYAEVVGEVGLPKGFSSQEEFVQGKAALGSQVKRLILAQEWPAELILRAVENYARRRRNPYFVAEWIRLEYGDEFEAVHRARRNSEPRDGGLKSLFKAMKEAGL